MPGKVKGARAGAAAKRSYDSPLRREQAAETRRRILGAADQLFAEQGFARTSVRQIAEAAGVAADTVYATFGTKARVLTALIDTKLAPSDEPSVLATSGAEAVRDADDQRTQLALFARDMAAISSRVRPVMEVLRTAAAVDPEMAAVRAEMEGYRRRNMAQVIEWLSTNGPLRIEGDEAVDVLWTLAGPDVGRLLCDERGWSEEQHAAWLEDVLARTLLVDPAPAAPTRRPRPRS